jgi:NADPH2:quinone reductase
MADYRMIVRAKGGPEVIEREEIAVPAPAAGEAIVRQAAIGLNFIDVYYRQGLYPAEMPLCLGAEGAGVVESVGAGVAGVKAGDRVAYAGGLSGAYATVRALPADLLVPLPDGIAVETAAAVMLKGMTADMLVGECGQVKAGDIVLVHSATGGVGALLVRWIKALGGIVIAHVGSAEKAERARAAGADHALHCAYDILADEVRALTDGHGADLVLDGVGADSWKASLASTARRGLMVTYGNASGPVPSFSPLELRNGSLFLTRPAVWDYVDSRARLLASAGRVFQGIEEGVLQPEIGQRFALADAANAHRALEARQTRGSTVLIP